MGVREYLNKNPKVAGGLVVVVIAAAGYYGYSQITDPGEIVLPPKQRYWTSDDGKTWFPGPTDKPSPTKLDGKEAVLVRLFSCDNGKTAFVGYLERYDDAYLKRAGDKAAPVGQGDAEAAMSRLVKKPGGQWASAASADGSNITAVNCPGGGATGLDERFPD